MAKIAFSGFAWDGANLLKCQKHGVSIPEIEHVLAHIDSLMFPDMKNSQGEPRYIAIGQTAKARWTFVVFTPRTSAGTTVLRPLSARYMHAREVTKYEKEIARVQKR
jgi:uncharacterized DUF497 family protein